MASMSACLSGRNVYLVPPKKKRRRPRTPKKNDMEYKPVSSPGHYSDYSIDSHFSDDEEPDPDVERVTIPAEFFARSHSQCTSLEKPRRRPASNSRLPADVRRRISLMNKLKRRLNGDDDGMSASSSEDDLEELFRLNEAAGSNRVARSKKTVSRKDDHPKPAASASSTTASLPCQSNLFHAVSPVKSVATTTEPSTPSKKESPSISLHEGVASSSLTTKRTVTSPSTSSITAAAECSSTPVPENKQQQPLQSETMLIQSVPLSHDSHVTLPSDSDDSDCLDVTPVRPADTAVVIISSRSSGRSRVTASASRRRIDWKSRTTTSNNSSNKSSHPVKSKRQAVKQSSSGSRICNRSGTSGTIEKYLIRKVTPVLNCD